MEGSEAKHNKLEKLMRVDEEDDYEESYGN